MDSHGQPMSLLGRLFRYLKCTLAAISQQDLHNTVQKENSVNKVTISRKKSLRKIWIYTLSLVFQ